MTSQSDDLVKTRRETNEMASKWKYITVETSEAIRIITLNRAAKRNAVNAEMADELYTAFREFDTDDQAEVAILAANGGNFCAGYDLATVTTDVDALQRRMQMMTDPASDRRPMGPTGMRVDKPVLAAIEGYCVAGGLELALWADMRFADENAIFGVFCRRFGVPLIDGGTFRLPSAIGTTRAMDMIISGRPVDAATALEWGLVNQVCLPGTAFGQTLHFARKLLKFPQRCLRADRRSMYAALDERTALQFELRNGLPVLDEAAKVAANFASGAHGRHGSFRTVQLGDQAANTGDKSKL